MVLQRDIMLSNNVNMISACYDTHKHRKAQIEHSLSECLIIFLLSNSSILLPLGAMVRGSKNPALRPYMSLVKHLNLLTDVTIPICYLKIFQFIRTRVSRFYVPAMRSTNCDEIYFCIIRKNKNKILIWYLYQCKFRFVFV